MNDAPNEPANDQKQGKHLHKRQKPSHEVGIRAEVQAPRLAAVVHSGVGRALVLPRFQLVQHGHNVLKQSAATDRAAAIELAERVDAQFLVQDFDHALSVFISAEVVAVSPPEQSGGNQRHQVRRDDRNDASDAQTDDGF